MESMANWALFSSEGKKTIPTPYWPSSGNFILDASNSFLKKLSGTCIKIPAPSPARGSAPTAPL